MDKLVSNVLHAVSFTLGYAFATSDNNTSVIWLLAALVVAYLHSSYNNGGV